MRETTTQELQCCSGQVSAMHDEDRQMFHAVNELDKGIDVTAVQSIEFELGDLAVQYDASHK